MVQGWWQSTMKQLCWIAVLLLVITALGFAGCAPVPHPESLVPTEDSMPHRKEEVLSAQVVLKPASGKSLQGTDVITAKNIQEYAPSAQAIAQVPAIFQALGFEVSAVVGNSFSITAPASTFEQVFHTQLRRQDKGTVQVVSEAGVNNYELPLAALPQSVTPLIAAITFTPPPDFGPTNFGP